MPPIITNITNERKEKKAQAKKRKLEAFLNLVQLENKSVKKLKSGESFSDSFKALKDELKKYQTKQEIEPALHLKDAGRSALVQVTDSEKLSKCDTPLFITDVYHLLLKSLLGPLSPFSLKWCSLERPQNVTKTVVIDIEGLSKSDLFEITSELSEKCKLFQYVFKVVSSHSSFASELCTFHMPSGFYSRHGENPSIVPVDGGEDSKEGKKYTVSKLNLLLSPIQLAMENYPLPPSVFEPSRCDNYVFTKESYAPVTVNSPMFAMDCEMCRTLVGNEVTRVAVVNEDLETVYHALVKPQGKIVDYLTKYSGITPKMLKNVTTTLNDVHENIRRILPRDAILCGQSLNCDLHAMKMIHPYVIDTSIIFNTHGERHKKTSLKQLTKIFLRENIQGGKEGHNPVEDSVASMKLVQLKLQKSIDFGDAVLSPISQPADDEKSNLSAPKHAKSDQCGFFDRISKFSKKKVCLIGNDNALSNYCLEKPYNIISKKSKASNKKVIKSLTKNLNEFDLVISHLSMNDESSSVNDIVDRLKQAYEHFPSRTLFLLIANHHKNCHKPLNYGYCMAVLKNAS